MRINKKSVYFFAIVLILISFSFWWFQKVQNKNSENEIVFGWMTDVHLGDSNHAEKLATFGDDAIERVMPKMIEKGIQFNVVTGDMIDNFHKEHDEVIDFHKTVKDLYNKYPVKTYYVIGNHDVETTTKEEVIEIYNLPNNYYSFEEKGLTFIVLDQQFNRDGSSYEPEAFHYIPGAVHEDQLKWFEEELEKAPGKIIVLLHQPIFSVAEEEGVSGELYTYNGDLIQKAMEKKSEKILAVLTGHKQPTKKEMDRDFNGVRHLMIPSAIFKGTRLSHAVVRVDLTKNKLTLDYYADEKQEKIDKEYDEVIDKCKGPDEEEDYYVIMNLRKSNPEKFQKLKEVFDEYGNTDFRNNPKISDSLEKALRDFEDYDCYSRYLKIRQEFAGY